MLKVLLNVKILVFMLYFEYNICNKNNRRFFAV